MDRSLRMALAVMLMWVLGIPVALVAQPRSGTLSGPISEDLSEKITSQKVAALFLNMAQGLSYDPNMSERQADLAVLWLEGAQELKESDLPILPVLLDVVTRFPPRDHTDLMLQALRETPLVAKNVGFIKAALSYILAGLHSSVEQQRFLESMVDELGGKIDEIDSELALLLGLVAQQAGRNPDAQTFFLKAYRLDATNGIAFSKLSEMIPDKISAGMFLSHLRTGIQVAPLNLDNALAFAQYAERLELYSVAAGAYAYCADLFKYLYPDQLLPPHIYLPWAMSVYNDGQKLAQIMEIAQRVRQGDRFDIFMEAIVGKAADKAGRREEGTQIFNHTVEVSQRLLQENEDQPSDSNSVHQIGPKQLAWFYNFALKDRAKALDWSNRAYADDPNSTVSKSLLAYSLVMLDQLEYASALLDKAGDSQIALMARAQLALKKDQHDAGIKALQKAITKDPGSLVAEEAKRLLAANSIQYHPPYSPSDLLQELAKTFGPKVLPEFRSPDKAFTLSAGTQSPALAYTQDLEISLSLSNHLESSLRIGKGGLVEGWVRIDAQVTGDAEQTFPKLVQKHLFIDQWLPTSSLVTIPLDLSQSALGQWLSQRPQADVEVHLTITLDPVEDKDSVRCRLSGLKPITLSVQRPKVNINPQWLQNQYNDIAAGTPERKIEIAKWFSGLLKEIQIVQMLGQAPYPLKAADWLAPNLETGLAGEKNLLLDPGRTAWPVRVCSMACLQGLSLDAQLSGALSKNLRHPYWPVRFMAIYILSRSYGKGFNQVLQWTATYDKHARVRTLAELLQASLPGD